jgi:hypothetical protein
MARIDNDDWGSVRSYYYENKEYLLKIIMKQLGITESDLHSEPSLFKAKVRDGKIDNILTK